MSRLLLAVCADDLRVEIRSALARAAGMGFTAVETAAAGPLAPRELSGSGRRHLARHVAGLGLRLAAIRLPEGGCALDDPAHCDRLVAEVGAVIDLAYAVQAPVVSIANTARSQDTQTALDRIVEPLSQLAGRADRAGIRLAIETAGHVPAIADLVRRIGCPCLAAGCDTGALLMSGGNVSDLAGSLAGLIALVRARDAIPGGAGLPGREVAMGDGRLDIPTLVAALVEAGYRGDIVLTRTGGANPDADLRRAGELFRRHVG